MERYAWRAKVKDGYMDEYIKRHDEIWPEMIAELKKAGIKNYTIFADGNELFGYYECEKGADFAEKVQTTSAIVKKWDEYMKDILIMEKKDNTKAQPRMIEVFSLD